MARWLASLAVAGAVLSVIASPAHSQPTDPIGVLVTRVVDGDTVDLDDGTRVRLFGVNTPELDQRCGPEARDVLAGMLADKQRGNIVYLEAGPRETDDFGRRLAYVWVNDGGDAWSMLDEWLVVLGFGEAWRRDGQHRDRLVTAEEEAVRQGAGCLWAGRAAPAPAPAPASPPPPPPPTAVARNCHPSYPDVCIPPPPPDLDCRDIPYRRFRVLPPDPHRFDSDRDGVGCE